VSGPDFQLAFRAREFRALRNLRELSALSVSLSRLYRLIRCKCRVDAGSPRLSIDRATRRRDEALASNRDYTGGERQERDSRASAQFCEGRVGIR